MIIEREIMKFIVEHRVDVLDIFFIVITHLGDLMIIWILISIFYIIKNKKFNLFKVFIFSYLISYTINDLILKHLIQRERPFLIDDSIINIISEPTSFSMPSGHSASSFVAAALLAHYFPYHKVFFYILAFLIAFSRVYVGVHFPTDVLLGALLGFILAKSIIIIVRKLNFKER